MNKTIASISAAVIVGTSSLSAYLPVPAELGVTSDLTFASEYNFRGYEVADNSFQPSLEASFGDFYLGIFANLAVDNRNRSNQRVDNELQYYGGFEIAAPQFESLVFDVGGTVYHWPDSGSKRTHEVFIGTKLYDVGIEGINVGIKYYYDFDRRTHVAEGSAGYIFEIDPDGDLSLDVSAFFGQQFGGSIKDRGARVNEDYHYYGASAELPFRLNEFSKLTPGVHYATAEKADLTGTRGKNLFWTISYTAGF
ncbi:MAG TPA: TorF family putative porin [Opitutales bacterium]|nr:TorF family putative porin [Opitutales bacterium]